jgi:SARP family transcriptional regulator, regulator of embCAB operon
MIKVADTPQAPTFPDMRASRGRVSVLGGFRLYDLGTVVPLAEGSQRLLAILALRGQAVRRVQVAGTLWPDASDARAFACLRSAVARLLDTSRGVLSVTSTELELSDGVTVDFDEARGLAQRLLDPMQAVDARDTGSGAIEILSCDLLPGWYDDWILLDSEQWRQLRLHALEALATRLTASGRFGEAVAAAIGATRIDPLRESARATLIRVHIAEHNQSEALREFGRYRQLLRSEVGLEPTLQLARLVEEMRPVTPR